MRLEARTIQILENRVFAPMAAPEDHISMNHQNSTSSQREAPIRKAMASPTRNTCQRQRAILSLIWTKRSLKRSNQSTRVITLSMRKMAGTQEGTCL